MRRSRTTTRASISVLIGHGDGTFNTHVHYAVGSGPHSIRTGDLNADGHLDLAVANDASNSISVLLGLRQWHLRRRR